MGGASPGMTPAELEELYRRHGRRLFGLAWQLTTNGTEAEDAVQETFLRALRALESYEERSRAGAWLDRILVNVVRERGRRRAYYRRNVEPDLAVLAPPEADPAPGPDRALEHSERLQAIRARLAGIPPTFREVLVLRHFEERSTAEVASLLDLPEATVRTRLKRARDMLVRAVSDEDGSPREEGS
jgi:RNA polymerase sigma-70 factor (ECF subfamily)